MDLASTFKYILEGYNIYVQFVIPISTPYTHNQYTFLLTESGMIFEKSKYIHRITKETEEHKIILPGTNLIVLDNIINESIIDVIILENRNRNDSFKLIPFINCAFGENNNLLIHNNSIVTTKRIKENDELIINKPIFSYLTINKYIDYLFYSHKASVIHRIHEEIEETSSLDENDSDSDFIVDSDESISQYSDSDEDKLLI